MFMRLQHFLETLEEKRNNVSILLSTLPLQTPTDMLTNASMSLVNVFGNLAGKVARQKGLLKVELASSDDIAL